MNSFWWSHLGGQNKGNSWLSWDKLSIHKNDRGMGFKNLLTFNLAMLGKQGWLLMTNFDSLTIRLYNARNYPRCSFFESTLGHKPNFVWRRICNSKFILKVESRWRIGDGKDISVWYIRWIANDVTLISHVGGDFPLADLESRCMLYDRKELNLPFLKTIFDQQTVKET